MAQQPSCLPFLRSARPEVVRNRLQLVRHLDSQAVWTRIQYPTNQTVARPHSGGLLTLRRRAVNSGQIKPPFPDSPQTTTPNDRVGAATYLSLCLSSIRFRRFTAC